MQYDATPAGLERAFEDWAAALNALDLDTFYSFFAEDSEILDEDYPWRMTKMEFVDHIAFHGGVWESFQWVPRETAVKVWGTTGHVSGFSTFRGKPRDAGFRQRFMGFTTTWVHADGRWVLVSWHQSVLAGRILGASPS
ncbi:MAG: nuclear transport factor 2 family protein [Thermoleophilia bacterium]|nr:nuclear transport factor 2 family protein [Thermoleophilia bacterium]